MELAIYFGLVVSFIAATMGMSELVFWLWTRQKKSNHSFNYDKFDDLNKDVFGDML